jgi:glycosyltransferase involved in cell wall biosynthesis
MRVLHVVKGLGPGGAERLLVSLTAARSDGCHIDVAYLLPHKDHLVAELEAAGASVHLLSGSAGQADPRWPGRLLGLVRRRRPDVIHLHSPVVASVARVLVRLLPRRPAIVSTEHNVWPAFNRATRLANGLTLSLSDGAYAVSEEVRSSTWSRCRSRLDVVVQGIPTTALAARAQERDAARASLGFTDATVVVATVANFREKKDYPTLLAAAAACSDEPMLRFIAIGQGPLEAELNSAHRKLGLGDRFQFLGYVADPPATVAGADLFVLSSRHEGLPIALLEAMALGVPPIATAVGGIPEVVTDGVDGVLVEPGDPRALAEAIRGLAADPARRRELGLAAGRRAADFDITRAQQELERRYGRLVAERSP